MKVPWRRGNPLDERARRDDAHRAEFLRVPVIALRRHARLEPIEPDDVLVSVGVGSAGEAVALWSGAGGRDALRSATVREGGATFPNARSSNPVGARITLHTSDPAEAIHVRELSVAHPFVQPLPSDRILLVGARCYWRPDGPEENAIIVNSEGELIAAATLGDGIDHVLTTPAGEVWVGYSDEGVYGNYGWGTPGPELVGRAGIVRWTADLEVAWRYPYDSGLGLVDDCYALNVDSETAWACYYSDFPVVRIENDAISGWRNEIGGAHALTVSDSTVALFGGYGPERDRVVIGRLSDGWFDRTPTSRLALDDGRELPSATLVGRGAELHVFVGTDWYKASIDELAQDR